MNVLADKLIFKKSPLLFIVLLTVLILLIPFVAMQFTSEVNWQLNDFIMMGLLCIGFGSLFLLVSKKFPQKKMLIALIIGLIFIAVWAELAVGVFTTLGS